VFLQFVASALARARQKRETESVTWLETATQLRATAASFVIVTVAVVRGHAPRAAGAKMIVTLDQVTGSVGGGNLEQTCIERAHEMLRLGSRVPELLTVSLTERAGGTYGVQCCGGEVTLMLEPIQTARSQVVIFGAGHVGIALTRALSALPLEVLLIDSRLEMLEPERLTRLEGTAHLETRHEPVLYGLERVFDIVHPGASVLVMTHDHLEDLAILEAALKRADLAYIGLIGSSAKWATFTGQLRQKGFTAADLSRVTTPIGVHGVRGKQPEVIAIAVAAQLLMHLELPEQ
jgi:xanthine dehydrogenase accessory factor